MKRAIWLSCSLALGGLAAAQESLPKAEISHVPQLTRAPTLVKFISAVYPKEAEAKGLTGDVGLEIDIGPDGKVTGARVTKPAGHGFDEAALAAVKQFVFSPAEIDHAPAAVTIGYVYHFVLGKPVTVRPPPPPPGAQVAVSGTVLTRGDKKPVVGATLQISGVAAEIIAGEGGHFSALVPVGLQTFSVFAAGDEPLVRAVSVHGKALELTFYLRPKLEGFHTVVKTSAESDVVERYTLQRDEIRLAPGTLGDPLHVITDLPGVARSPFDLGFLIVRGADPQDTDFYIDGLQVPLIYHFGGGPAVINPEFVDTIDFYPGGQGAKYGHGIGGVVDASSRKPETDRLHVVADLNTEFASGFVEVPLGDDTSLAVAGRRSYFDLLLKPFLGAGTVVVPYFWDYQVKLDHGKPGDKNRLSLMVYGSNDSLQVVTGGGDGVPGFSLSYFSQFHRAVAKWAYQDGRFKSTLSPMLGIENDNLGFVAGLNDTVDTVALRHDMSYEVSKQLHLNFGEDVSYQVTYYQVTVPTIPDYFPFPGSSVQQGSETFDRAFHQLDLAPWAEAVVELPRGIRLVPGLRFDEYHVPMGQRSDIEPRLVLRWQLSPKLVAKGSIGLYHEPPLAQFFDAQFGNPALGLESALQYSGGFEYQLLAPLSISLVGFYSDRFGLVNGFFASAGPGGTNFNNDGLGRAYGLEAYLHHDFTTRFFGWLSYTLSRSEFDGGTNQPWGLSDYDETHILAAVASYNLGAGFTLGARFRLVTGLPTTAVFDATYDSDQDQYIPIYGPANGARLPTFRQLDVRLDKEFTFEAWKLDVYLDCWNATNAQNEEGIIYDYRYRTSTIIPSYPILPMLGLRGEY
ncbi:MAG: TonB family protein [Deltaproteobacteria bacterium]